MSEKSSPPEVKKKLRVKSDGLWLMSFADLSFVLMCFFALMLSFSSTDKQRFENVRDGMLAKSPVEIKDKKTTKKKKNNLKSLSKDLIKEIEKQKLAATVTYKADGVAIELNDKLFFRSGSANLQSQYRHLTSKVMKIIANAPSRYQLVLEGHTDDIPLGRSAAFRSNWELSSARSVSMLNELKRYGVSEDRMSVIAYAHTKPKVDIKGLRGSKLINARRKNRRVVIHIR